MNKIKYQLLISIIISMIIVIFISTYLHYYNKIDNNVVLESFLVLFAIIGFVAAIALVMEEFFKVNLEISIFLSVIFVIAITAISYSYYNPMQRETLKETLGVLLILLFLFWFIYAVALAGKEFLKISLKVGFFSGLILIYVLFSIVVFNSQGNTLFNKTVNAVRAAIQKVISIPSPQSSPILKLDDRVVEFKNIINRFPKFSAFLEKQLDKSLDQFFYENNIDKIASFIMDGLDKFEEADLELTRNILSILGIFSDSNKLCNLDYFARRVSKIKLENNLARIDYIFYSKNKDKIEEHIFPLRTKGDSLTSKDHYKIYFTLNNTSNKSNYFVYIYQINYSNGEATPLFPNTKQANPVDVSKKEYVLPTEDQKFELSDIKGTEKIYFLVSAKKDIWLESSAQKPETIQPDLNQYIETLCRCNTCFGIFEFNHN